jgi:hypothetical protein
VSEFYKERREDKRLEAQLRRQEREAQAEQARKDQAAEHQRRRREQADRAQRRTAQAAAARGWLAAEADTAFSVALILLAVIPAISSQVGALTGKTDPGSATALALMLELGAWSATVGASRAMKDGRPVTPYRVAMWGCAAIAAAINVAHNGGLTDWFALVMGAASLAGVAFWELRCVGRHGTSRRTKEERATEKARRVHAKNRAAAHRDVQRTAERIVAAATFGEAEFEQAFTDAWEVHHGTREVGLTPAMVALRAQSTRRMADALAAQRDAEPLFPDTVPDDLLAAFTGPVGSMYRSPVGRPDGDDGEGGRSVPLATPKGPSSGPARAAESLGGKGKERATGGRRERTRRPLDDADIDRVRAYADLLAEGRQTISVRKVGELLGGGENDYLSRLTRHVKDSRGES